jgi:hypothetical protein
MAYSADALLAAGVKISHLRHHIKTIEFHFTIIFQMIAPLSEAAAHI